MDKASLFSSWANTLRKKLANLEKLCKFIPLFVFCTGLITYFTVQGALVGIPLYMRALPVEVDDALVYIMKSVQMESCFQQDCLALQDLRAQWPTPSYKERVSGNGPRADNIATRIFCVYHPLYSISLLGLHKLGLTWLMAYKVIWGLGVLFFGLVFAHWCRILWGVAPAGIGLLFLAFQILPGHGLRYIVPSSLAMGIAVFVWARIVASRGNSSWFMVIGTLAMVSMHPIGRLYGVMALALAFLLFGIPRTSKALVPFLATGMIIIFSALLPIFVQRPDLSFPALPDSSLCLKDWVLLVHKTLDKIVDSFDTLATTFGSTLVFGVTIIIGYLTSGQNRQKALLKTTFVMASALFLSIFYINSNSPDYPADLFRRLWPPFVILLSGAFGQAIWYALKQSIRMVTTNKATSNVQDSATFGSMPISMATRKTVGLITLIVLVFFLLQVAAHGTNSVLAAIRKSQYHHSMVLNPDQPALLLSQANPGDRVLYFDMFNLPFYFMHGAMQLGAVLYPAVEGTPEEDQWLRRRELRFAVTWTPVQVLPLSHEGMIPLELLRSLHLETTKPVVSTRLKVFVDNQRSDAQIIEVTPIDQACNVLLLYKARTDVPAKWSGWVELNLSQFPITNTLQISLTGRTSSSARSTEFYTKKINPIHHKLNFTPARPKFYIGGIVFGDDTLHWPWTQKATLTLIPKEIGALPATVNFDPATILPPPVNEWDITVLDDHGSTVLFRINR